MERHVGWYCCLGCFWASLIMVNFELSSRSKFSVFGVGEKENVGTGEMAHQLRVLATKCGDPSLEAINVSSPRENNVEIRNCNDTANLKGTMMEGSL